MIVPVNLSGKRTQLEDPLESLMTPKGQAQAGESLRSMTGAYVFETCAFNFLNPIRR